MLVTVYCSRLVYLAVVEILNSRFDVIITSGLIWTILGVTGLVSPILCEFMTGFRENSKYASQELGLIKLFCSSDAHGTETTKDHLWESEEWKVHWKYDGSCKMMMTSRMSAIKYNMQIGNSTIRLILDFRILYSPFTFRAVPNPNFVLHLCALSNFTIDHILIFVSKFICVLSCIESCNCDCYSWWLLQSVTESGVMPVTLQINHMQRHKLGREGHFRSFYEQTLLFKRSGPISQWVTFRCSQGKHGALRAVAICLRSFTRESVYSELLYLRKDMAFGRSFFCADEKSTSMIS